VDVAVVTGAGRGLGLATVRRLSARGLAVLVTDLDAEAAELAARDLGSRAWSAALDVRDPDACRAIAREAASRGRLVTWVNNAGVLFSGPAWTHSDAEVDLIVGVNLMGVVHGCRAALEEMEDGGRILNVASLSALGQAPGVAVYAATKHAVLAFGTSLEADLRAAGRAIEVRTLCPDVIDTQMARDQVEVEQASILLSGAAPLSVDEVADRAVALLESKRSRAVMPAWRGALLRLLYRFPRLALRAFPLLGRIGEVRRRRWQQRAAGLSRGGAPGGRASAPY
jgi:NAD(P)-dependent dehydrogenase (short-subunit alcohol dehydrogenase family)